MSYTHAELEDEVKWIRRVQNCMIGCLEKTGALVPHKLAQNRSMDGKQSALRDIRMRSRIHCQLPEALWFLHSTSSGRERRTLTLTG